MFQDSLRSSSFNSICPTELILKELSGDPSNVTNSELAFSSAMDMASSFTIEQDESHEIDPEILISTNSPNGGYIEDADLCM